MARCPSTTLTISAGNTNGGRARLWLTASPRSPGRPHATQLPDLTPAMPAMTTPPPPDSRHDQAARRLMVASTSSTLSAVVDMLMLGISLEDISVPPAAAEYARRFAQHDLSLEALLRAYRLGEHTFLQWVIQDLSQRAMPADDALAVTGRIALLVNGYIDRVIEGLTDIYQTERQRWEERSDATRTAQVRAVLATDGLTTSMAEQMLGLALRGWHIAAVAWVSASDEAVHLHAVGRLLAEASGRTPVLVHADASTIWAWMSFPDRPSLNVDPLAARLAEYGSLRIALGEPGAEVAGFRTSHEEALRARQVAEIGAQGAQRLYPRAGGPGRPAHRPSRRRARLGPTNPRPAGTRRSVSRPAPGDSAGVAGGERQLPRSRRADARAQEHRSLPRPQGRGAPGAACHGRTTRHRSCVARLRPTRGNDRGCGTSDHSTTASSNKLGAQLTGTRARRRLLATRACR